MALDTDKEQVMNTISSLGFEVFRNGSFHWKSSNTPDMRIYKDGKIRCWTSSPFKDNKSNHGDLIDFIKLEYPRMNFIEAREKAHKLLNLELPSLDTYEGYSSETIKKDGFISKDFMKNFENWLSNLYFTSVIGKKAKFFPILSEYEKTSIASFLE